MNNEETGIDPGSKLAKRAPRYLGAAFLVVIVTSLLYGTVFKFSGSISDILKHVAGHQALLRLDILFGLLNSVGVIFLATLLYVVLRKQSRTLAIAALICWICEAVLQAVCCIGDFALIPLSVDFVGAGSTPNPFYQTLGTFLHGGLRVQGMLMHMWFYCVGGLLWYYLFYKSRYLPRALSILGIVAVIAGLFGTVFQIFGYDVQMYPYVLIGVFEFLAGAWLAVRGARWL